MSFHDIAESHFRTERAIKYRLFLHHIESLRTESMTIDDVVASTRIPKDEVQKFWEEYQKKQLGEKTKEVIVSDNDKPKKKNNKDLLEDLLCTVNTLGKRIETIEQHLQRL